jgi:hypothetical protein
VIICSSLLAIGCDERVVRRLLALDLITINLLFFQNCSRVILISCNMRLAIKIRILLLDVFLDGVDVLQGTKALSLRTIVNFILLGR